MGRSREAGEHGGALPVHDREAMGTLLATLEPRMAAVALRYTRDPDTARDVVQSAFEKVLRHAATFRGQSRVSTWVHRIVANEALMWLRSERRRPDPGAAPCDAIEAAREPAAGPQERLERRETLARLERGLARLSPEEGDVMRRCALEGEGYAAYGARRGLHVAAVKSRAFRARRRLAQLLDEAAPAKI